MMFGCGEYAFRLIPRQHAAKKADRENLVAPYVTVATIAVDCVVDTSRRFVPKLLAKAVPGATSQLLVVRSRDVVPKAPRQIFHGTERVVPECFNLDGF